jgi:hypothetical protein
LRWNIPGVRQCLPQELNLLGGGRKLKERPGFIVFKAAKSEG